MSKEIKRQLSQITKAIISGFKPKRVILFGSYASGKPKEGSDFDFFIVKESNLRQIDRAREVRKLLPQNRSRGVDLIVYSPKEFNQAISRGDIFIKKILEEGKELYVSE